MLTIRDSKQDTIALSEKEFFFLAGIIGSDRLLGVEDPFSGYLAEEIAEEWEKTKDSLLRKQYLLQKESGELSIPPEVFSRVAIAGLSDRACWLKYERQGREFEGYLHVTDERVIQVCRSRDNNRYYMLSELGSIERTCDQLVEDLALSAKNWGDIPALLLSRKEFGEIYTSASELTSDEISDRLARLTNDEEGSIALAKCLKNRVSSGELQLSIWNGLNWESQNAAFVVNESMNWLLRMSLEGDQDWLTAAPATKEQFRHMLLMWLKQ